LRLYIKRKGDHKSHLKLRQKTSHWDVVDVETVRIILGKTALLKMLTAGDVTVKDILQKNVGQLVGSIT